MKQLMLSCRKATEMMEKKNIVGLSPIEKVQLFLHTTMCDACKTYQKQSRILDAVLQKRDQPDSVPRDLPGLTEEAKNSIINEAGNH